MEEDVLVAPRRRTPFRLPLRTNDEHVFVRPTAMFFCLPKSTTHNEKDELIVVLFPFTILKSRRWYRWRKYEGGSVMKRQWK